MTDPRGIVDFFALEAGEYLERMDAWLAGSAGAALGGPPDVEPFVRSARALRGAATMARQPDLAALAEALGRVGTALQQGRMPWNAPAMEALAAAVEAFRRLLRAARDWTAQDAAEAHARTQRLDTLLGGGAAARPTAPSTGIVPVRLLAPDDGADHVVHRAASPAITADQRFRQAAVPLAQALRRAIAEARRVTTRDDAARLTVGEDLRGALRDLRDLAESYDVRPVVNFCAAREAPLAALDDRALDTVDGAAGALVESAGATWARATPAESARAIAPSSATAGPVAVSPLPAERPAPVPSPAPEPAPEPELEPAAEAVHAGGAPTPAVPPPAEPRAPHRPATGAALVALLESGLSGMADLSRTLAGGPTAMLDEVDDERAPQHAAGVIPIDRLVYRGRAALDRARAVRDELRGASSPDVALLAELYDLLDLISLD